MTPRRTFTLLEFAIAASLAVVPVLLVVLLASRWLRPLEAASQPAVPDRHLSVRHIAALKTFEHAIVRRDSASREAPTAQALVAEVPACRREWDGAGGALDRLRRALAKPAVAGRTPAERIAAELGQLDAALARFSTGANRRVSDPIAFDVHRWTEAVTAALRTPVEAPEYPGHRFVVQCADVASAVTMLVRADARMLDALAWRGTAVPATIARWRADQFVEVSDRLLARPNPWAGIPGCVYLGGAGASPGYFVARRTASRSGSVRSPSWRGAAIGRVATSAASHRRRTRLALPIGDERWKVPPSLHAMLQSLDPLQRPASALHGVYAAGGFVGSDAATNSSLGVNRILLDGRRSTSAFRST